MRLSRRRLACTVVVAAMLGGLIGRAAWASPSPASQISGGGILHGIAGLLGARADKPDCGKAPKPSWVDGTSFIDDKNAPLLVCVAGDPSAKQDVIVKVAVNRGYGVLMHTGVMPAHESVDLGDGPLDLILDGVVHVPKLYSLISGKQNTSTPVMATQTATFTFTEAQVRANGTGALIQARLNPEAAAAGALFKLIVGKVTNHEGTSKESIAASYFAAYATVAQCEGQIIVPISKGHWSSALSGASSCIAENYKAVTHVTAGALAQAFPDDSTEDLAGKAADAGKVLKALGIITGGLDATEWLNDHRLDPAGLEVHLFPKIKPTHFTPDTSPLYRFTVTSPSDYTIGPWSVGTAKEFSPGWSSRVTLAYFMNRFGSKDRCSDDHRTEDTVADWPSWGMRGDFTTLGGISSHGHPITHQVNRCDYPAQIQVDNVVMYGPHWHTADGLRVGDPVSEIPVKVPGAVNHTAEQDPGWDGWWLHTVIKPWDPGDPQPDLLATVFNGRILSFTMTLQAEGE